MRRLRLIPVCRGLIIRPGAIQDEQGGKQRAGGLLRKRSHSCWELAEAEYEGREYIPYTPCLNRGLGLGVMS